MRLLAVFTLLVLAGCGGEAPGPANDYATFVKLIDSWRAEAKAHNASTAFPNGLIVRIEATGTKEAVATCTRGGNGVTPIIRLEPSWWGKFSDSEKESVLYHEMGHCILLKSHEPVGIMEPRVLPEGRYKAKRAEYLHEYFNKGENK